MWSIPLVEGVKYFPGKVIDKREIETSTAHLSILLFTASTMYARAVHSLVLSYKKLCTFLTLGLTQASTLLSAPAARRTECLECKVGIIQCLMG